MLDIRTARKIADDVGNVTFDDAIRQRAFHRLDIGMSKARDNAARRADQARAQVILDYFGNRAAKGKRIN
jgi:hypothetical protein